MKKLLVFCSLFVLLLLLGSCSSQYEYDENDFQFIVEVSKTDAKLGDTIEVTAKLKNTSGRNIRVLMADACWNHLEDMILIGCEPGFATSHYYHHDDIPKIKLTFKKNQELIISKDFVIDELNDYEAMAFAGFYYGKGYSKGISLKSNYITINVLKETTQ